MDHGSGRKDEIDDVDVDLIVSGHRFSKAFKGKADKDRIKKKHLDVYNNLRPKDVPFSERNA